MSSSSRRPARPPTRSSRPSRRPLVIVGVVAGVVVLALVAALVAGDGDSGGDGDRAATAEGPFTAAGVADDTPATVTGEPLAAPTDGGTDPAVGQPMPTLSGTGLDGQPLTIPTTGRPTMVVFLAHWCPHCQAEVPVIQQWVDDGGLPEGVDLVAVSTAADERRPNHPPAAWLDEEGWTAPVLVDGDDTAAEAVGLTAFPFFVGVDAEGNVVGRGSGELTPGQLSDVAADLAASAP